jgi:hypothetical protein
MKLIQRYFSFFVGLMMVMALLMGSQTSVSAQTQEQDTPDALTPPLFPSLTWNNLGYVQKDVNVNGQILTLDGEMFEAVQVLNKQIPQKVFNFYSPENLQTLGWSFLGNSSFESAYGNSLGRYLVVKIVDCENSQTEYCVNVWLSADYALMEPVMIQPLAEPLPEAVSFYKKSPKNGTTIDMPDTTYRLLNWTDAQIGSTDRYEYCIDRINNNKCDTIWRQRNSLYSGGGGNGDFTLTDGKIYYWQVRTRDVRKYADNGAWWSFKVKEGAEGPVVSSVIHNVPNTLAANTDTVKFKVTFSEAVTGVSVNGSDFNLTTTDVTETKITGVFGSGQFYYVTVDTGKGNGTIRLDVIDDDTIVNAEGVSLGGLGAGNANYIKGKPYTIDKISPKVSSVVRFNPSGANTNLGSVVYTVTFSETVTEVNEADFNITLTGSTTGASVSDVTGTGKTYKVTVNTGSKNGTLRLDVKDNDSIIDAAGNMLGGPGTGNGSYTAGDVYTIDKTIPIVKSITLVNASPTNLASVKFTVTFSESVTGVGTADFSLTKTGITGPAITSISPASGKTYTVTVNTGTGDGTLRLNVVDDDTIRDATGNRLGGLGQGNGTFLAGATYTIDKP